MRDYRPNDHIDLSGDWTLTTPAGHRPGQLGDPTQAPWAIPATVPGTVHTDLLAAGLIPDPYLDSNESSLVWIGWTDWVYQRDIDLPPDLAPDLPPDPPPDLTPSPDTRCDLVAYGLDTVAEVALGGVVVGQTANQHRTYRWDLSQVIGPGINHLSVHFAAPRTEAERRDRELGALPHAFGSPFNALRKAACNFGWDWGPDLATCGIWRPIALEIWRHARIASIRPLTEVIEAPGGQPTGRLTMHFDLERTGRPVGLRLAASIGPVQAETVIEPGQTQATLRLEIPEVDLWWPRGYGRQPTYAVTGTLETLAGERLGQFARSAAFRTIELDQSPDAAGRRFALVVNGRDIFAKGVDWIPDDCFFPRVGRARYQARLRQAVEAGVNTIRVWGGGIYEDDQFYDLCDELGLLVWQDFAFACAAYSEDEPLRSEVEAEARDNIIRLMGHPSLAIWCGCNENIWGIDEWGWTDQLRDKRWGLGYYLDLLPRLVAELDPTRPYTPGSPFSPDYPAVPPNAESQGTMHEWDVWNQTCYARYRDIAPRFVSEFGYQGPPTWATLTRAVHDQPLVIDSPGLLAHQKAVGGMEKFARGIVGHFPPPANFDDWHWTMSLEQARALTCGVERFRALAPHCMGAIWWQLNDCWPVASWAVIDGDGRRKPAFYAMRQAFADRLITVQDRSGQLVAALVNDTDTPWRASLTARRLTFDGAELAAWQTVATVPARWVTDVALPSHLTTFTDPAREALELAAADAAAPAVQTAWHFGLEDLDLALPTPAVQVNLEPQPNGLRLHLRATTFLRDLAILADRIDPDAVASDMLWTLAPGQEAVLDITSSHPLPTDPTTWSALPVLRTANHLIAR